MTTTVVLACLIVGQATANPTRPAPIPMGAAQPMTQAEAPAAQGILYGEPTPADPMDAPNFFSLPPEDATPLPREAIGSSVLPQRGPDLSPPIQQTSAVLPASTSVKSSAETLLDDAFASADTLPQDVAQVRLMEVLANVHRRDPALRLPAIRTYWEAATLWADWQFAGEESELLNALTVANDAAAQAKLQAARAAAQARLIEAQMAVTSAQLALAELSATGTWPPPVPVDRPLVGSYTTQFDKLFGNRPEPASVRRIHNILPIRHQLVEARAAAVAAGRNSLSVQMNIRDDQRQRLDRTLTALDDLRRQRGAFLGAVRDYNLEIAEYALTVAQPNDPPEKIVAMLIEVKRVPAAEVAQQPLRSVLISPRTGVAPAGVLTPQAPPVFSAPGQVSIPGQLTPGTTFNPAGVGAPVSAPNNGFREVPDEPKSPEATPRSIFGNPADSTPALPPLRP